MSSSKVIHRSCTVTNCKKAAFSKGYCAEHHRSFHGAISSSSSSSSSVSDYGLDDMVLLPKLSNGSILANLECRHRNDLIYTYIGHVVVSMNPYKPIPIYTNDFIKEYSGKYPYELPPHLFAMTETAYKAMIGEEEDQCVIISGESGAGKTEAAKQIMNYIAAVSGRGEGAQKIKDSILESNPLLEAFGNAKTLRNNNSSRFGKYVEIKFDGSGTPRGGYITNYLLEKSRIVFQTKGERNFHIFYQLVKGAPKEAKKAFKLGGINDYHYIAMSGCSEVEGVDDHEEFEETRKAMKTVSIGGKEQEAIFQIVSAVLHIGNLSFKEDKKGATSLKGSIDSVAELLGVDGSSLTIPLLTRHIKTAREEYDVPNNEVQANAARDALAKSLYSRLFDFIVRRINNAIAGANDELPLNFGILDIYGFEVFQTNGFEQFCINYVNEKLQQIFIELTLKSEQEEYVREGIEWKPIPFFNNIAVLQLIESTGKGATPKERLQPGIFLVLDDVCATTHAVSEGADRTLSDKLQGIHGSHPHFAPAKNGFLVKHYAGDVVYNASDFPSKNKDTLFPELISVLQTSSRKLIPVLFPDEIDKENKKRPPTFGYKIRTSAATLVEKLMKSQPSYVRCIKPNDLKKPDNFDAKRVEHQIQYLGLLENIKVRRAGFAYRAEFDKFLKRFRILSKKTWPEEFQGSDKDACKAIIHEIKSPLKLLKEEVQIGKSKIFIKQPETVFAMDALKEEKIGVFITKIQRAWRKYKETKKFVTMRQQITQYLWGKKERRRESFYRPYSALYFNFEKEKSIRKLFRSFFQRRSDWKKIAGQKKKNHDDDSDDDDNDEEKILFTDTVHRYVPGVLTESKEWKREKTVLILTTNSIFFFSQHAEEKKNKDSDGASGKDRQKQKEYIEKKKKKQQEEKGLGESESVGKAKEILARRRGKKKKETDGDDDDEIYSAGGKRWVLRRVIPLVLIKSIGVSPYSDNFLSIHINNNNIPAPLPPTPWLKDNQASECEACGEKFGLFLWRHHCRLCGLIYCQDCSNRLQLLTDYSFSPAAAAQSSTPAQKIKSEIEGAPVRICDSCFGKESNEYYCDQLIQFAKKTEFLMTLEETIRELKGISSLSSTKKKKSTKSSSESSFSLNISFSSTLSLSIRLSPTQSITREISFSKSSRSSADDERIEQSSESRLSVKAAPGLDMDFVAERQKAAEKRREKAEKKRKQDMELRKKRDQEREEQREAERKIRIAEKKAKKAEELARKQIDEENRARAATTAPASASSIRRPPSSSLSASKAAAATPSVSACKSCGCNNFVVNPFKKNKCNSCFHEH